MQNETCAICGKGKIRKPVKTLNGRIAHFSCVENILKQRKAEQKNKKIGGHCL